jgi:hypothetical protein
MYESRYLGRLFLSRGAAAVARLFDLTVDRHLGLGFDLGSARLLAHAAVPFDDDPEQTRDTQSDWNRAVHDRCWSIHERALAQEKTMRISNAFPSNYVRAADLQGRQITVTIERVEMEDIGGDPKPILFFRGKDKGMVLNKTNANNISTAYGDDTDDWAGKPIVLFEAQVDFQGKTVPAIRVKIPRGAPSAPSARPPEPRHHHQELPDDEIPF